MRTRLEIETHELRLWNILPQTGVTRNNHWEDLMAMLVEGYCRKLQRIHRGTILATPVRHNYDTQRGEYYTSTIRINTRHAGKSKIVWIDSRMARDIVKPKKRRRIKT